MMNVPADSSTYSSEAPKGPDALRQMLAERKSYGLQLGETFLGIAIDEHGNQLGLRDSIAKRVGEAPPIEPASIDPDGVKSTRWVSKVRT